MKALSSHHGSAVMNLTGIHEDASLIPGLTQLRIQHFHELCCRLQVRLGSHIPVLWCRPAAAALIWPLACASVCHRCGPKNQKKKREREMKACQNNLSIRMFLKCLANFLSNYKSCHWIQAMPATLWTKNIKRYFFHIVSTCWYLENDRHTVNTQHCLLMEGYDFVRKLRTKNDLIF